MQVAIHYDDITNRADGLILKADTFTDEQLFAVIENLFAGQAGSIEVDTPTQNIRWVAEPSEPSDELPDQYEEP